MICSARRAKEDADEIEECAEEIDLIEARCLAARLGDGLLAVALGLLHHPPFAGRQVVQHLELPLGRPLQFGEVVDHDVGRGAFAQEAAPVPAAAIMSTADRFWAYTTPCDEVGGTVVGSWIGGAPVLSAEGAWALFRLIDSSFGHQSIPARCAGVFLPGLVAGLVYMGLGLWMGLRPARELLHLCRNRTSAPAEQPGSDDPDDPESPT